jgi:hypothetical protein
VDTHRIPLPCGCDAIIINNIIITIIIMIIDIIKIILVILLTTIIIIIILVSTIISTIALTLTPHTRTSGSRQLRAHLLQSVLQRSQITSIISGYLHIRKTS